jgi:zinc transport system substrate-binding protein
MLKHRLKYLLSPLLIITIFCGCQKNNSGTEKQPEIAVTNSYLSCVVKDICGNQTDVLSLIPPGMCPGHFDMSPSQVNKLSKCEVLLLFDFQKSISDSLSRLKERGLKIRTVECPEGMCLPQTYLTIARSAADALSQDDPAKRAEYDKRLELIEQRLSILSDEIHTKMEQSQLIDAAVVASGHQAVFCDWLGLDVIATFSGSDVETPGSINQCLQSAKDKTVKLIVANEQEGTALAEALAERLGANTVVFSNFPAEHGDIDNKSGFDSLLLENISGLIQ